MKRTLLFTFLFFLFTFVAHAQYGDQCDGCNTEVSNTNQSEQVVRPVLAKKKKISVYPNPAVDFIGLSDIENVKKIVVFNVMGRETKSFKVEKGIKYDVSDLKRGMYLVQIIDLQNKIMSTQRLNKR